MNVADFCKAATNQEHGPAPKAPGLYVILNAATMRAYIGKTTNLSLRFATHRAQLRQGIHHNARLQADWRAYGEGCFRFFVFSQVEPADLALTERALIAGALGPNCYNYDEHSTGRPPIDATREQKRQVLRAIRLTRDLWAKVDAAGMDELRAYLQKWRPRAKHQATPDAAGTRDVG